MHDKLKITSVCVVTGEENFITRIADVHGRNLELPHVDRTAGFTGLNRDKLYFDRQSVPNLHKGALGVWDWTVSPGRMDSSKEWIDSEYQPRISPIEVIDFSYSEAELKNGMKEGLNIPWSNHRRLILYDDGNMHGVLCLPSQMEQTSNGIRLKEHVYVLPCYNLKEDDLLDTEWVHDIGDYCLYRSLDLPAPTDVMIVRPLEHAVKQVLLEKLNKRFLMDSGATRKEAQQLQSLIEQIADENIPEKITSVCNLPIKASTAYWKKFQNELALYIQGDDIGNEVLRGLLKEDETLRQRLKEEWKEECHGELKQCKEGLQKDLEDCKAQRKDLDEEKKRLAKELEEARSKAQKELERIQLEKKTAEERLEKALEEAEQAERLRQENVEQYKQLGEDSLRLVREKLSLARKEASEFLADLALFGTPGECDRSVVVQPALTAPASFSFQPGKKAEEKEDVQETKELLRVLRDNLENAGAEHAEELAHFLFGAFQSRTHLILAGPQGMEVANALSCAMTGRHAAVLDCCGDWTPSALDAVLGNDDTVIAVKHPFHRRWIDQLAPELDSTERVWIFLHPYADDLALEPTGLYSYVFPVALDLFIIDKPSGPMIGSRKSPRYKEFGPADNIKDIKEAFKTLGLKPAVKNRGHELAEWACTQMNESRKDFFRFACLLFPLAVAFDKKRDFLELLDQNSELKSSDISLLKDSLGR